MKIRKPGDQWPSHKAKARQQRAQRRRQGRRPLKLWEGWPARG